jgi:glyoxylase-like metal-dependent hydrolase (beta-lactamase superfamily II)
MGRSIETLSDRVRVVLGQNPGILTGPGTNTYLVGTRAPILIDTGAGLDVYESTLREALAEASLPTPRTALITHAHPDHLGGGDTIRRISPSAILHKMPRPTGREPFDTPFAPLSDGQVFATDGATLEAIYTPGHANDHCVFYLREEKALFTGDLILGTGTVLIPLDGGDMADYLDSLERLLSRDLSHIYPGHGPVIPDARAKIEEYLAHRRMREAQVLEAVQRGIGDPWKIVREIYTDVPEILHPAAKQSVIQHLRKLVVEGKVAARGERRFEMPGA